MVLTFFWHCLRLIWLCKFCKSFPSPTETPAVNFLSCWRYMQSCAFLLSNFLQNWDESPASELPIIRLCFISQKDSLGTLMNARAPWLLWYRQEPPRPMCWRLCLQDGAVGRGWIWWRLVGKGHAFKRDHAILSPFPFCFLAMSECCFSLCSPPLPWGPEQWVHLSWSGDSRTVR
jgi:hypothetical protein